MNVSIFSRIAFVFLSGGGGCMAKEASSRNSQADQIEA